LRDETEGGGNYFDFVVAREAEVNEPFAVDGSGHLFESLNAPLVVPDQLVIGRQDARDSALDWKGGKGYLEFSDAF